MIEPHGENAPPTLERVQTPLEAAEIGQVRTSQVVSEFRGIVAFAKSLYLENGYVPKLRAIFREGA